MTQDHISITPAVPDGWTLHYCDTESTAEDANIDLLLKVIRSIADAHDHQQARRMLHWHSLLPDWALANPAVTVAAMQDGYLVQECNDALDEASQRSLIMQVERRMNEHRARKDYLPHFLSIAAAPMDDI